jgi:hypothetical protein
MTDHEAMQQALEALMTCGEDYVYNGEDEQCVDVYDCKKVDAAIDTLKQQLNRPAMLWQPLSEAELIGIVKQANLGHPSCIPPLTLWLLNEVQYAVRRKNGF